MSQGILPQGPTPGPGVPGPGTPPPAEPRARHAGGAGGRRDGEAALRPPEEPDEPEEHEGYEPAPQGYEPGEESYQAAGYEPVGEYQATGPASGEVGTEAYEGAEGYEGLEGYEGYEEAGIYGEAGVYEGGEGQEGGEAYEEAEGYDGAEGYETGAALPGVPPARRARRPHRLLQAVTAVVVVLFVAGLLGFLHISNEVNPSGPPGRTVTVVVPLGASTVRIADLLAKVGVIHGPTVFALYVKLEAAASLLPGTYHLATNQPYSKVVAALEAGPVLVVAPLLVPEGYTIRQMAAALGRLRGIGVSPAAFVTAATGGQVRSPYEPAATNNLEGLLFPATYPVRQGEPPDDLVQYMVDTFDSHAAQLGLAAAAKRLHYSPYQVVTVASIVEREAKLEVDRGPIASAIYNRLAAGMPIGADSTLLYALGDPKGGVDPNTPNPYNTRLHQGLPPTPIANPGLPSLEAALHPPHTSYLYWVEVNPDGKMGFASTSAGFVRLQSECRAAHLC